MEASKQSNSSTNAAAVAQALFSNKLWQNGRPQVKRPRRYEEDIDDEESIVKRINELRHQGRWSYTALPAVLEPPRPKTHWDFLLEEVKLMYLVFKQRALIASTIRKDICKGIMDYHSKHKKVLESEK